MTSDDLLVISPLDQDLELQDDDNHILERVEEMIQSAVDAGDYRKALSICKQIVKVARLSGLMLAKSLYLIKINWDKFQVDDAFDDVVSATTGLHKATVQRYTAVWHLHADNLIPSAVAPRVQAMNIKSQIPIAQTLDAGYEIDDNDWEELANATDFSAVTAKLREIKGKEPRSNAMVLMIDRDGGIKALKDDRIVYVGWLQLDSEDEVVQKAIQRIVSGSGLLEQ